jgi:hypothetical protein
VHFILGSKDNILPLIRFAKLAIWRSRKKGFTFTDIESAQRALTQNHVIGSVTFDMDIDFLNKGTQNLCLRRSYRKIKASTTTFAS